jgi:hypothetical protein
MKKSGSMLLAGALAMAACTGGASSYAPLDDGGPLADAGSGSDSPQGGDADGGQAEGAGCTSPAAYDPAILCDHPVAYWTMSQTQGTEPDRTGHGHDGTYVKGPLAAATMPNGDPAVVFDGATQYLTIPSSAAFSIPTTGSLTWEGWVRPDVLQFPHDDGTDGYVDWMGKCEQYAPTCEWEARFYDATTKVVPNRCNRFSAYAFNPDAGLGSGADWQPTCGLFTTREWLHVVGEYTTLSQPADCPDAGGYPGSLNIWVDGVEWSQTSHNTTGCMSQYKVVPKAGGSAVNVGTMARDAWFLGAIGKVAIYDHLLTTAQIASHYQLMTGKQPTGSCADTCTF